MSVCNFFLNLRNSVEVKHSYTRNAQIYEGPINRLWVAEKLRFVVSSSEVMVNWSLTSLLTGVHPEPP